MLDPVLRPSLMKELVIFPSHDDMQAGVEFTETVVFHVLALLVLLGEKIGKLLLAHTS